MMYAVEFEYRSDGGPRLVGPFASKPAGDRWVGKQHIAEAGWAVVPLYIPDLD